MKCELCNGELEVQAGGRAVCTTCGMAYSSERLREMIGKSSAASGKSTKTPSTQVSKIKLANSAFLQCDYAKTVSLCDRIIEKDSANTEAWSLMVRAQWADPYSREYAARSFAEACSVIEKQEDCNAFINQLMPIFMDEPIYSEITQIIGSALCTCDPKLAERYLRAVISKHVSSTDSSFKSRMKEIRDMYQESDLRYTALAAKKYDRLASGIEWDLKIAEGIWMECGEKCSIEKDLLSLVSIILDTLKDASSLMCCRLDIRTSTLKAEQLRQKIQDKEKRAVKQYWAEHAETLKLHEQSIQNLKSQIDKLNNQLNHANESQRCMALSQKIKSVIQERDSLGFFAFGRKTELSNQLTDLYVEFDNASREEKNRITNRIVELQQNIRQIESMIENPF